MYNMYIVTNCVFKMKNIIYRGICSKRIMIVTTNY